MNPLAKLSGLGTVTDSIEKVSNVVDKHTESGEERQATLTARHAEDMKSDNWLSKSVRPLTLLILLLVQIFIVVASSFGKTPDPVIVAQHGALLITAMSFYFASKRAERIADKTAAANIKLEQVKLDSSVKVEEVKLKQEVKRKQIQDKLFVREERQRLREEKKDARKERRSAD